MKETVDGSPRPAVGEPPGGPPTVSVVIPAYNSADFVGRAIESALQQTHRPLEIIVVDDGSSDSTADVVARYPVTLIRQANGGPASARNAGVRASRGEWIAFLDHDDFWHPNKTEVQIGLIRDRVDAVFCPKEAGTGQITFDQMYWRNLGGNPSSAIIRREALVALDLFDDDRALIGVEDYNLWLRFLLAGFRFVHSEALYDFTPAPGHYSGQPDKMLAAELANIDKISALAGLSPSIVAERKRRARLHYLPSLIYQRYLPMARRQLRALGMDRRALPYWYVLLPRWLLDLKRRLRLAQR